MLAPGHRVGPYTALFQLGKGGMGEVWAAARQQTEVGFTKLFALKVLARDRVGENDALMFYDEAKAASALQHASIVSTLELGQDGDVLYIAMDLVRGPSLTALLQRLVIHETRLSPAMVALIGSRIARALAYAYERAHLDGRRLRLVHRDVSPHNVLLDLDGSVRLTDFGVARTAVQDHRSRVGTIRGKPSYMAPEQVAGGEIDARTDVFALGIVLYECACLRRLFGRKNPVKSMDAVVHYTPKPLEQMVEGFPEALARAIERALRKAPEARFASAAEFADALEAAGAALPGWATAERDLLAKIDEVFETDAFDVETRAREGLQIAARRQEARAGLLAEVQTSDVEPPEVGRTTIWPTAPAPDPLAPEAIEEARTQLRPASDRSASSFGVAAMQPRVVDPSYPSYASYGSYPSASQVRPPPRRRGLAVLVGAASVLALVAIGLAVGRSSQPEPRPVAPPPPAAQLAAPEVEASPAPVAARADPRPGEPSPAASPPPAKARVEAEEERPSPRLQPARSSRPGSTRAEPSGAEPAPAPSADATYGEVQALLRQVRAVDAARAGAMLATLIEAGRDNVETLNRLRREARALLRSAGGEPPALD